MVESGILSPSFLKTSTEVKFLVDKCVVFLQHCKDVPLSSASTISEDNFVDIRMIGLLCVRCHFSLLLSRFSFSEEHDCDCAVEKGLEWNKRKY